ncbi:TPA: phage tail protein [Salmonella enterica subsp. enterica serovar Concord]|nr:phage tail protein [Salmonella enterica subsp. enterica serovar Concord]
MNKHTLIRNAVLKRLKQQVGDSTVFFDGLPAVIESGGVPALAVWLSDAQYTGEALDEATWQAILHVAVFLGAEKTDSELDIWMEEKIYPALDDIPELAGLIDTLVPQGYEYPRDGEMAAWSAAEITYQITYTM